MNYIKELGRCDFMFNDKKYYLYKDCELLLFSDDISDIVCNNKLLL